MAIAAGMRAGQAISDLIAVVQAFDAEPERRRRDPAVLNTLFGAAMAMPCVLSGTDGEAARLYAALRDTLAAAGHLKLLGRDDAQREAIARHCRRIAEAAPAMARALSAFSALGIGTGREARHG